MTSATETLYDRLGKLHLTKLDEEDAGALSLLPATARDLLRLCHHGCLLGGLSLALDLRPDELIGSLTWEMGGAATRLRVLDVRGEKPTELTIGFGDSTERWEMEELSQLVHNLNDLFRSTADVKAVAILGEWEDMLQLWCLDKALLPKLLREHFFIPSNRYQLEAISA